MESARCNTFGVVYISNFLQEGLHEQANLYSKHASATKRATFAAAGTSERHNPMERYLLTHSILYGYWYNCLQELFHRRIAFWTNFIQLVAGCSAVVAVAGEYPKAIAIATATAAACALLSLLLNPTAKEWHFKQMKCKFLDLKEIEDTLDDSALNKAIIRMQREGETGLSLLANPATNMARAEMGYRDPKDFAKIGPLEWLAAKLAY